MVLGKYYGKFLLTLFVSGNLIFGYSEASELLKSIKIIDDEIKGKFSSYEKLLEQDTLPVKIQILLYKKIKSLIVQVKEKSYIGENDKKIAKLIIDKAEDFELEDYDFDEVSEEMLLSLNEIEKIQFKLNYFASVHFITWNYLLSMVDSQGRQAGLYSKEKGPCIGGGLNYSNHYWGVSLSGCYAYMAATVGEDSTSIKYSQDNVSVDAVVFKFPIFWKPQDDISIGVAPLIIYHRGDYTAPVGGQIMDENDISVGYVVRGTWRLSNVELDVGLGDVKEYKSGLWELGLSYSF
ncbi:MAG: hypothetical protein CME70_11290 [Halobacteriovorax sp.]|nr:hypothetical protein [Halobacteriovorax sp.]|tara:strand:- start:93303 stop:94181 length:879 start_codon:yes stop_codon:yes gene_type:complete